MLIVGLTALAVAMGLALALTPLARRWALATGRVANPRADRLHRQSTPLGGGVAIYLATVLTIAGGAALALAAPAPLVERLPAGIAVHLPGVRWALPQLFAVLGGGTVLFVVGLVDETRHLSVRLRVAVQVATAAAVVCAGVRADLFVSSFGLGGELAAGAITVGWIVFVTNTFNLLDNSDGQCAGVAAVTGLVFAGIALFLKQWFIAAMVFALVGACVGYLRLNFPPARIFMGDSGSTFIGFILATTTVLFTFYRASYPLYSILVPVFVLTVPFFDTASVIAIRISQRRPITVGDRNHFAHRLMALGLGSRGALLVILLLTAESGIAAMLLYKVHVVGALLLLAQILGILAVVGILERAGRRVGAAAAPPPPA